MTDILESGREILSSQSFSVMLGTKLESLIEGSAELTLAINDQHKQNHGFVHGGVVSYMADNCITFAAATVLGNCVTSEYKINYVRPSIGEYLVARSIVLYSGKTQATCECKVYAVQGCEEKLVAVALGTINKVG